MSQSNRIGRRAANLLAIAAISIAPATAATFTVNTVADTVAVSPATSPNDSTGNVSLRSAIMAANAQSGADIIELQPGLTYRLTIAPPISDVDMHNDANGDLDIRGPLTINGHGAVVDAAGIDRVFAIESIDDVNFVVSFNDLTITGGSPKGFERAGGGISVRAATLNLTNCVVKGNTTLSTTAPSNGGGIAANGVGVPIAVPATLNLTSCTVFGNSANNGGGIAAANCVLTLDSSTVSTNTASGLDAGTGGGGIFLAGSISTGVVRNGSVIVGNTGSADGGGISVLASTLSVVNSSISGNTCTLNGGGVYSSAISAESLTFTASTISGNAADKTLNSKGAGGGVFSAGSCTLVNSTVSGNKAYVGGGISGTAIVVSSTIAANSATQGGGVSASPGTLSLSGSILGGNTAATGPDGLGVVVSQGYNIVSNSAALVLTGVTTGNLLDVNPQIGPLAGNGGPTYTHALLSGSPAIDAGPLTGFPATDQRGVARPQDGRNTGTPRCDMGSYEYVAAFSVADVGRALRIAGGILTATPNDAVRLDIAGADGRITLTDATRILRKVAGIEPNP
ncbi:MAG TPA: choice-of-anchor Q domain-containing protein [Armatimonadota bacterium]